MRPRFYVSLQFPCILVNVSPISVADDVPAPLAPDSVPLPHLLGELAGQLPGLVGGQQGDVLAGAGGLAAVQCVVGG